jgi:hypothetical protein
LISRTDLNGNFVLQANAEKPGKSRQNKNVSL